MQPTSVLALGSHVENLDIVQLLGHGAYGQVYLAQDQQTQQYLAVKTLLRHENKNNKTPQRGFQRMEIGLHARLSGHPHIIRLDRVIREADYTHIVMEYAPEGDLFTAITERDLFAGNHPLIQRAFLQLLDAVEHCHLNGVYHRDLKSENVLVFDGGRTIKLADFGLATMDPISTDYGCGSTFYFSPECQGDLAKQGGRVGYATAPNDIWALGVILINLAAGRNPWKQASLQDETFRAYLNDPDFLLKILPISRELNRILKRIFCIDPLRRIGLKELKLRIQQCKYFTRTAEVDRWERLQDLAQLNNNNNRNLFDIPSYTRKVVRPSPSSIIIPKKTKQHIPDTPVSPTTTAELHLDTTSSTSRRNKVRAPVDLLPSPPATPRDRSQQSSYDDDGDIYMGDSQSSGASVGNSGLLSSMVPLMA
ncbi:kinase-like domain-containing protein [Halteromyces radiatus]|uniref:kinase-like domain-containing protein n=1 Tax=Halteromyces radiatus TaxID=101107 RepID=UPI0022211A8D|nr:kinase-like domain-containing protein [Halteromyces radiatus]KAI8096977.1 kinase-like domain-containing protein [Halteromyces radiatus]